MTSRELREALAQAKQSLKGHPDVVSVGIGFKYRAGVRTDEVCIVVGVRQKLPAAAVARERMIPARVADQPTDVVQYGRIKALELTAKRRPCPPGYSIGHGLVTAGTLGAWVRRGQGSERYVLSNNHVLAASNEATIGDFIRQPGRADGGTEDDRFARLTEFVQIRFDGTDPGGKKGSAALAWRGWKWPANQVARLVGCPFRLEVRPLAVPQPYPNLVDAAIAQVIFEEWVDPVVPSIGEPAGIRDFQLGDRVQKTGRTTEHTTGVVEVVGAQSQVDYGTGTATYDDQLVIRADSGEFSGPGDSGSAVFGGDDFLGGLLFAGGEGVTIVNRISHVVSLLGVRVTDHS
jgi:hypothetical protein